MADDFQNAVRVSTGLLTGIERRVLAWLADRLPSWVNSDHLTALALFAMFMAGASYWQARDHPMALLSAVGWLAVNWFGDSLDGTLARVRRRQRPRYGFFVDHMLDTFGVLFVIAGIGLSGFMHPLVAAGVLVAYYVLSIELFLAAYCLSRFQMSFWKVGPTELRILLAIGTITLFSDPQVSVFGREHPLFDVGGCVAGAAMLLVAVVSGLVHVRELYLAEPLPAIPNRVRCSEART